jgi:hypothetical protein
VTGPATESSALPPPEPLTSQSTLDYLRIWGTGPADVWAVRRNGDVNTYGPNSVFHWDGAVWTLRPFPTVSAPNAQAPAPFRAEGLWGTGPNDVWATGRIDATFVVNAGFSYNGLLGFAHWDGAAWTVTFDPNEPRSRGGSSGAIWGSSAKDIWAGSRTDIYTKTAVWHYDGATWKIAEATASASAASTIWGTGPTDVWFGGAGVSHFDGQTFTDVNLHTSVVFSAIAVSPRDVWIEEATRARGGFLLHGVP